MTEHNIRENIDFKEHLSSRGLRICHFEDINSMGFNEYINDPFDKHNNPLGTVNMGLSENNVCSDIVEERVTRIIMQNMQPHSLQYADPRGIKCFKEQLASFLTEQTTAARPLNPDHIFVMNGGCSVFATLASVLCDPGDGYLLPSPAYSGVKPDMCKYADLRPVYVPLHSKVLPGETHSFQLTIHKLEAALQKAVEQGIRVRVLVLVNPNNPLGTIYSADLLQDCLQFAHRHKLHVIIDEIYMLSIHEETTFTSILALKDIPDPERIHYMWGFSKDFAMGGFRCGVLYTTNQEVQNAVAQLSVFHQCPVLVQQVLTQLLHDRDWINCTYLTASRKRLRESYRFIVDGLVALGIPVLQSSAGLYAWANFRRFLRSPTFECEMELWQKMIEAKVFISPGKAYSCCEPGWYRIICSYPNDVLAIGLQRLRKALQAYSHEFGSFTPVFQERHEN